MSIEIKIESINNGWLVFIKESLFEDDPIFFKTKGQAIGYVKRRLNSWKK